MAEANERSTLNRLIEICRDGERGFRYAANHVDNPELKALFLEIAAQRQAFSDDLLPHAQRLGGADAADGSFAGALHRGWITLRDAVGGHDDTAIVHEAERGERAALTAYEEALNAIVPPTARDLIEEQRDAIRASHARLLAQIA